MDDCSQLWSRGSCCICESTLWVRKIHGYDHKLQIITVNDLTIQYGMLIALPYNTIINTTGKNSVLPLENLRF